MTDYVTTTELRDYIGSDTTYFEPVAQAACTTASRLVEAMCDRVFTADALVSARVFTPYDDFCCPVDDFYTTAGLLVSTGDGGVYGTYGTTWTITTDFAPAPINGRSGPLAVPYSELVAVGGKTFARWYWPTVSVTAKWGWAAVPDAVKQATLMAAAQLFKLKDAPDGFVGLDGWGPTQVRENRFVRATLAPYMKHPIAVA